MLFWGVAEGGFVGVPHNPISMSTRLTFNNLNLLEFSVWERSLAAECFGQKKKTQNKQKNPQQQQQKTTSKTALF